MEDITPPACTGVPHHLTYAPSRLDDPKKDTVVACTRCRKIMRVTSVVDALLLVRRYERMAKSKIEKE